MKNRIALLSITVLLILLIEWSRRQGFAFPAPFTLIASSILLAAALGGLLTGTLSAIIVCAYTIYSSFIGFGPDTLIGGTLQTSIAIAIFLLFGVGIGYLSDRLRYFVQQAQQKEEQLEKNFSLLNSQIKSIFQFSPVVIYLQDATGHYQFANKEFSACYGFSEKEIQGKSPDVLHPQFLVDSFSAQALEVLENRAPNERAYDVAFADGTQHSIVSKKFPVLDDNGKLLGVGTIDLDVTDSMQYQKSLRISEENLNKAQQIANIGSWSRDVATDTLSWSANVYRIFGFEPFSFEPNHSIFLSVIHPDDLPLVEQAFEAVLAGQPYNIEHRIIRGDGSVRYVRERAETTFDDKAKVIHINGTVEDITERTQAEQDNRELEKQLEQSRKMETIGMLTGGIAHDFNNILTPIAGYIDMARIKLPEGDPLAEDMKQVSIGVDRAKDLIQQILLFSRKAEATIAPVDVKAVIIEALKLIRSSIPANINIEQALDGTFNKIQGDETQIHQVILNLCSNASQAMVKNGGTLSVKLEQGVLDARTSKVLPGLSEAEYLCLTVSDTGLGMDAATQEAIFDPFFTTKRDEKGTGLGLSVVLGIVKSHNGDIRVESETGKGAAFHIYLPVAEYSQKEDSRAPEAVQAGTGLILLVDDEERNLRVFEKMLDILGYNVESSISGEDALEKIQSHPEKYDLVLSDMTMPGITGIELAEKIHQLRTELPIVIMTGFAQKLDRETQLRCNIREVIQKPIKLVALAALIQNTLSR